MRRLAPALLTAAAALAPTHGDAQAPDKVHRVGVLSAGPAPTSLFPNRLRLDMPAHGFVEGRNFIVEWRYAGDEPNRLPAYARELVGWRADVIVAIAPPAVQAAIDATRTIPIVMFVSYDPVAAGWAESLARPGRNATGVVMLGPELDAKRLQLLHEAVPAARRIAVLAVDPNLHAPNLAAMQQIAAAAGLTLLPFYAPGPAAYAATFAAMREAAADALVVIAAQEFFRDWAALNPHAVAARLATVCQWREMAVAGCVLGYGPSFTDMSRRVVGFVARIIRGGSPAELPIEEPTHFEFAINLNTAKAIGIELPLSLLARADEVIE